MSGVSHLVAFKSVPTEECLTRLAGDHIKVVSHRFVATHPTDFVLQGALLSNGRCRSGRGFHFDVFGLGRSVLSVCLRHPVGFLHDTTPKICMQLLYTIKLVIKEEMINDDGYWRMDDDVSWLLCSTSN